ncbi:MAG: C69 family dipeptidase [Lachnospiraceae bacterium]|nr:C69 family dipeptidase [Lachnospiraceae bacterium]
MDSCDTLVLTSKITANKQNTLCKNSDRPLGEAQPLCFYERSEGKYAVLGSRPYWMDGFEMGANEKGLFIGNEAEGSRMPKETEEGITGMAMLRTALEKAAAAREAIDVIADLLKEHGQNANAHPTMDRRYENTFILCDQEEAWVMETAGREWAAKKVEDFAAVSNCYQITDDYDLCSEGMEQLVTENRWLRPGEKVNFAKAFTAPADRQRNSVARMRRMQKLVTEKMTVKDMQKIFRDHFEGELNEPRFGSCYGNFVTICMHALTGGIDSSQTAASMIMSYDERWKFKFLWAAGLPCLSVYIPLYWVDPEKKPMKVPDCMSLGGEKYDPESLWWTMEHLSALVSVDEEQFGMPVRESLRKLEKGFEVQAEEAEEEAEEMIDCGNKLGAAKRLNQLTESCAGMLLQTAQMLTAILTMKIAKAGGLYGPRKELLEDYMTRTEMPMDFA